MHLLRITTTVLALVFASQSVAQTRSIPRGGLTFNDVVAWLRDQGREAKIAKDLAGNTMVAVSAAGFNFGVYLFDCQGDRCGSIQFATGPHLPKTGKIALERVNEWNKTKRWQRAYLTARNELWLEADFDLTPGGTYELLKDEMDTWLGGLKESPPFFGLK